MRTRPLSPGREAAAFRGLRAVQHLLPQIAHLAQLIGVRRFELRTSPTRTERATRLRHTPSGRKGSDNRPLAHRDEIIRLRERAARGRPLPGVRHAGAAGAGRGRGDEDRLRRLVLARALRARGRGGRAARDRPPRDVLAQRAGLDRPAPARPAGGALRGGPQPRRVPPRARRASRARQQRAARRRARRRGRAAVRRGRPGRPLHEPSAIDALVAPHPRGRRRARATRLRPRPGADPAGRDLLGRRRRRADPRRARGLRPLPHRRAARSRACRRRGSSGSTSSQPATTRPSGSASRRSRSGSRSASTLEWEFIPVENPV